MKKIMLCFFAFSFATTTQGSEYLGQLSVNPYASDSTSGVASNNFRINQAMGSKYTSGGPKLYNSDGEFRGNLNGNRFDPDSVSNPYGRYGRRYSSESINNSYGAGSEFKSDSPNNPYGSGWAIIDE